MTEKFRLVHYINQFYAGIGGEEKADITPFSKAEVIGPGLAFQQSLGDNVEIVGTVVCGDSYFNENLDSAKSEVLNLIKEFKPDIVVAGPAFNAGRYGMACGAVSKAVMEELNIPAVTGMYEENPGLDLYRKDSYIVPTKNSAAGMRKVVPVMAKLITKLLNKEAVDPETDNYYVRHRKNVQLEERGSARAVDMLVKKIKGEDFVTEYPMPEFDNVAPAEAIKDLSKTRIGLVTSGGIVPKGNPDHIESSSASKFGTYDISGVDRLTSENYETAHGGYDPIYANEDPNRVLPLDVVRQAEKDGKIGSLHPYFYTTVGNGTAVANAKKYAAEIAKKLLADGVEAVILTSTWGTCTRCGATMVKEIEKTGIPVVHMCTVVPISLTVGANRIVPTVAIPHPLGNPSLAPEEEYKLRKQLVDKALNALTTPVDAQTVFE